ncbi:MAG: lysophospholipid acyltransferase family protein [Rectinemataceae bacterium]|nr:lysophospholipid acyltransferase family protein [Rectinemataceae bacterium]
MRSARRYTPANSRFFTTLVRWTYGIWLRFAYNIEPVGLGAVKNLKPPFVLVGNHASILDPFILNAFVPHPVHWVTSDGNMRTPLIRFLLLKLAGSIPKSKAIPDIETVNWIVEVIRGKKGVVGLYPEGQASWDGCSIPSYPSTAKLLKILKAPVLLGKTMGGYLSLPRWTGFRRRGKIVVEFSILFTAEELKILRPDEIHARLEAGLYHDETAWEETKKIAFVHPRRAEHLELAFFICPSCFSVATMRSRKDRFFCNACGLDLEFDEYGCLNPVRMPTETRPSRQAPHSLTAEKFASVTREFRGQTAAGTTDSPEIPRTVRDWEAWQQNAFREYVIGAAASGPDHVLLSDAGVKLSHGWRMEKMQVLGQGRLTLYRDRLVFTPESGPAIVFRVSDIEGPGVLKKNLFEFYVEKSVYRATFPDLTHTGRSWAVALEILGEKAAAGN